MDCVVLGAEGVCESGGIINQLGTLTLAIVAQQVILLCVYNVQVILFFEFLCPGNIVVCVCAGSIVVCVHAGNIVVCACVCVQVILLCAIVYV